MRIIKIGLFVVLSLCLASPSFASYSSELRQATERNKLYDLTTMDPYIIWNATMFTPKFRRAYEEKHIKLHKLSAMDAARFVADSERDQAEYWEFFVSIYTLDEHKEFSMNEDSFWKIKLFGEDDEKGVAPISIEHLPKTPYYKTMFKYVDRWSRIYKVVFPKIELGQKAKLLIRSVLGESELEWNQ